MSCLCFSHTQQQRLTDPSNVDTWQCHKQNPVIRRSGGLSIHRDEYNQDFTNRTLDKKIYNVSSFKKPDHCTLGRDLCGRALVFVLTPTPAPAMRRSRDNVGVSLMPVPAQLSYVLISCHKLLTPDLPCPSSSALQTLSKCLSLPLPSYLFVYFV